MYFTLEIDTEQMSHPEGLALEISRAMIEIGKKITLYGDRCGVIRDRREKICGGFRFEQHRNIEGGLL